VPDGMVPADQRSFGQNVVLALGKLAEIADGLGVPALGDVVLDPQRYWDDALRAAGWRPPHTPSASATRFYLAAG